MIRKLLLFFLGSMLGTIVLVLLCSLWYVRSFLSSSGLTYTYVRNTLYDALNRPAFNDAEITMLLLGLDERSDALETTQLTDTILLAQLRIDTGELTMIPIPRDLWLDRLKTKVNALYYYGQLQDKANGAVYAAQELEHITGIPIHYWIVMNYNDLDDLVDLIGGIEVDVAYSFTDERYPNEEYLTNPRAPVYKTVSFEKGRQYFDGETALAFVRSRSSETMQEGSDIARSARQVQVFTGITRRLRQLSLYLNPERAGLLYQFWDTRIQTDITDAEALSIALSVKPQTLSIRSIALPTGPAGDPHTILVHPPIGKYGLWVWEPKDPTWQELKTFMHISLET